MQMMEEEDLPEGWKWVKLGDIGGIASGGTPSTRDDANFNGDIPWVTPADLSGYNGKFISRGRRNLSEKGFNSSSATLLPGGTVLYSSRAPIGLVAIAKNSISTNQGFKNIVPSVHIFNEYVYYYLKRKNSKKLAESFASGTTFKELSARKFSGIPIPLPPLGVQRKIVAILEKADALRQMRREADRLTKDYLTSVFLEMFGDPVKNPNNFKIMNLVEVLQENKNIVGGPFGSNLKVVDYKEEGIPIIRLQNIKPREFIDKNIIFISERKAEELSYHSFKHGDIILAKLGDPLGKSCIVPEKYSHGIVVGDVIRIRVPENSANKEFILNILNSKYCIRLLTSQVIGATRNRVNLNDIRNIPIPIPPIELQNKFAQIVHDVEEMKESQKQSLEQIDDLHNCLMQKAFRGELVC